MHVDLVEIKIISHLLPLGEKESRPHLSCGLHWFFWKLWKRPLDTSQSLSLLEYWIVMQVIHLNQHGNLNMQTNNNTNNLMPMHTMNDIIVHSILSVLKCIVCMCAQKRIFHHILRLNLPLFHQKGSLCKALAICGCIMSLSYKSVVPHFWVPIRRKCGKHLGFISS